MVIFLKVFRLWTKNWRKIGGWVVVPSRLEKILYIYMFFAQTQMKILWICLKPLRNRNSFTKFQNTLYDPMVWLMVCGMFFQDSWWYRCWNCRQTRKTACFFGFMAGFFKDETRMIKHIGRGDRIRPRRISIGVVSLNSNLCFNWENNSKRWDVRKILRQPQFQGVASLLLAKKHCFD